LIPHCLRQFARVFVLDAGFAASGGKARIQHLHGQAAAGGKAQYISKKTFCKSNEADSGLSS